MVARPDVTEPARAGVLPCRPVQPATGPRRGRRRGLLRAPQLRPRPGRSPGCPGPSSPDGPRAGAAAAVTPGDEPRSCPRSYPRRAPPGPARPPCAAGGPSPHRLLRVGRCGQSSGARQVYGSARDERARPTLLIRSGRAVRPVPCSSARNQTVSSLRPFDRRAARIARPARVRIRSRKPCFLARRRLLGWKVRLDTGVLLEGRRTGSRPADDCDRPDGRVRGYTPTGPANGRSARPPGQTAAHPAEHARPAPRLAGRPTVARFRSSPSADLRRASRRPPTPPLGRPGHVPRVPTMSTGCGRSCGRRGSAPVSVPPCDALRTVRSCLITVRPCLMGRPSRPARRAGGVA